MLAWRLRTWILCFSLAIFASSSWGQEPAANIENATTAPQQSSADELPSLPETVVTGRTNDLSDEFPKQSLPNDAVISASRTVQGSGEVGSSVTVITQEQLQQTRQQLVSEALRGKLGVDVVRQGGPGGVTSVFLRGANSQHTKVLIDGIPINDPSNATRGFDFSSLTTDNIERIEVLRGPQSILYGSDAIGGVVNIITKRGQGPLSMKLSTFGGSFGTAQTGVSASGGNEKYYYSTAGSWLHTDGISAADSRNGNPETDRYRNGTISGRYGVNPNENCNVDYVFRYTDAQSEVDDYDFGLGRPVDNLIRQNLSRSFYNRVQLQSLSLDETVEQRLGFNLTNYNRRDTDPGPFSPERFDGQTREVDYILNMQLTENNLLSGGGNYLHEEAFTTTDPLQFQTRAGIFVNDNIQIGENWTSTAGARWDNNNRAGPASTYRVTSIYKLPEQNSNFHGSIGTGFRAPALAESLFAFGNPNLRPEESKGWDVGYGHSFLDGGWIIDATYFRNDFTNLIVFDFNTFALANVGQARSSGVELTSTWLLTDVTSISANYTFTDTYNGDTGDSLLRRPRNKLGLTASRSMWQNRGQVNAYMLYVDNRLDTGGNVLSPYITLNLSGNYRPSDRWEFTGRIDNLTDTRYQEVFGYGTPGISGYGGLNLFW